MDRISTLPDDLLLSILLLLPGTKDVVLTMVLSKRWKPLWMMVPKLIYNDGSYQNVDYGRFLRFVDRSLLLHKAPILKTLHFKVGQTCGVGDIPLWIRAADNRSMRELVIEIHSSSSASRVIPTRIFYTGCRMLAKLKLNNVILVDATSPISFPSLKKLILLSVKYPNEEFIQRLLSNCPVLESLHVEQCLDDNVTIFTVRVPSLKRLFMHKSPDRAGDDADGFVIDAPSLKRFYLCDYRGGFCTVENKMPNIVEADMAVGYPCVSNIMGSITSVKHLCLCLLESKDVCPVGSNFHSLVHLEICTCEPEWLNTLLCMLRYSPKLQHLRFEQFHPPPNEPRPCWSEPKAVPECLLSSLETFKWVKYEGTEEEKEVGAFILRNGSCLKKVTISSKSTDRDKKLEMITELSFFSRLSPTCHLTFD